MSIKAETTFSLKDQLFNSDTVRMLAQAIQSVEPSFPVDKFVTEALAQFPELELKQRIHCLVSALEPYLPNDFCAAQAVLLAALPPPLDPQLKDDDFGHFIWVVPGEYVARHVFREEHVDRSLQFLSEATKRFSSEFAIRPFLHAYPQQTMAHVHEWVDDEHYHLRRLASEGIRPFLPWAQRVVLPLQDIVAVLDRLHADNTRFVTRSVANTLNDISRLQPELAIETAARWQSAGQQSDAEVDWMVRHGLRTLVKDNHADALALLGYPTAPAFSLSKVESAKKVQVGDNFTWRGVLTSKKAQKLRINLRIYFLKSNGRHSIKVFAIKDAALEAGESVNLEKRIAFKPQTTRVLYPGQHHAELVVNGVVRGKQAFELIA